MNWKIKFYKKINGDIPVLEYVLSLPPKHRAKIVNDIDILKKHGINLIYAQIFKKRGLVAWTGKKLKKY
jgi:phage-related protein